MSENLEESKQLSAYVEEPAIGTEKELIKTNIGMIQREREAPRAPDYVGTDNNACAWVRKHNAAGEPIEINVKIGGFYFTLKKRFL